MIDFEKVLGLDKQALNHGKMPAILALAILQAVLAIPLHDRASPNPCLWESLDARNPRSNKEAWWQLASSACIAPEFACL
jgi:hypothetical protein